MAIVPTLATSDAVVPPASRMARSWSVEEALVEIVRGRVSDRWTNHVAGACCAAAASTRLPSMRHSSSSSRKEWCFEECFDRPG